jgi:hypothetical protein
MKPIDKNLGLEMLNEYCMFLWENQSSKGEKLWSVEAYELFNNWQKIPDCHVGDMNNSLFHANWKREF